MFGFDITNFNCKALNIKNRSPALYKIRPNFVEIFPFFQKNPGNVLYVVTERAFPTKRVKQILDSRQLPSSLLDRIIIKVVWEEDHFLDLLRNQIISSKLQLNMIVIDSLAGPLRSDFENVERIQRALQIHKIGQILHQLSRILNVPIGNE